MGTDKKVTQLKIIQPIQTYQLVQNGKINPQNVDNDSIAAVTNIVFHGWVNFVPSYWGASIQSIISVKNPAQGVHSHHRIKCTRQPSIGSIMTGTGNNTIMATDEMAINCAVIPPVSTPENFFFPRIFLDLMRRLFPTSEDDAEVDGVDISITFISHTNGICFTNTAVVKIDNSTRRAFRSAPVYRCIDPGGAAQ
jgi:hypothetical protein